MTLRSLGLVTDGRAKRLAGVVKAGLGRSDGNAEGIGDLGQRKAEVVVMDDDGAMVDRKAVQAAVERVAVGERTARIRCWAVMIGEEADIRLVAALPPRLVIAGVDDQAAQPRVQSVWVTQRPHVTPRPEQPFLHGVLGPTAITQDQRRSREQSVNSRPRKASECVAIPIGCRPDQPLVSHLSSLCAASMARLHGMADAGRDRFSRACSGTIRR